MLTVTKQLPKEIGIDNRAGLLLEMNLFLFSAGTSCANSYNSGCICDINFT
jgi:hypothetical protein